MGVLKRIEFRRYKRLDRFSFTCGPANILVGPNNAGKSSILDALRILQAVQRYCRRLKAKNIRTSQGDRMGYEVPDGSIPINIANVVHNYGEEDAIIEFVHENGKTLTLELHPDRLTRVYLDDYGRSASSAKIFDLFPVEPVIVPTLSPFEMEEEYVTDETVERNKSGRLASRHFRNLWCRSTENEFNIFSQIVSETWPGVELKKASMSYASKNLYMFYREGLYEREISWSGFGFQVWLQIITHMLRGSSQAMFVLDEPDIYLHPDLQSKLLTVVRDRFDQFFLATHSTEIINNSRPGDIVSINSKLRSAKRVRSNDDYNHIFSYIGSIDNIELSRLSRAKRVIFLEGKDKSLLTKLSKKAGYENIINDSETLVIGIGGFSQWKRVVEAAWTFRNVLQFDIRILSIFDRDYRDKREIDGIVAQVASEEVKCSVWSRKEIENYLLIPEALYLTLEKRICQKHGSIGDGVAKKIISDLSDKFKHDVYGQILASSITYEKGVGSHKDVSTIASECSRFYEVTWKNIESRLSILPGKQFISDLSTFLQESYGVTITHNMILEQIKRTDLDPELVSVLAQIEEFCSIGN